MNPRIEVSFTQHKIFAFSPNFTYTKVMENYTTYRTAESVSPKHPDKLCDQISDAILDAYLAQDPNSRVAAEVCGGHNQIFITGEITSTASDIDITAIAHRIAGEQNRVSVNIVQQSPEIAQGVDLGGAGDQGIMIGYACNETPELLPYEVVLSRRLNQLIFKEHPYDGKTQVTIKLLDPDDPYSNYEIDSIVTSFQNTSNKELEKLVQTFLQENQLPGTPRLHLNPAGEWKQGGFDADTGLTGRKLIVDNYGPRIPIGGGAFSGKDPSKVDRSAAYMARRIAVDYLHERQAHEVFVRLAYAIGLPEPLEHTVIIDGQPEQIPLLQDANNTKAYDLTPQGIINFLNLKRPFYEATARYGHFGEGFDWDK